MPLKRLQKKVILEWLLVCMQTCEPLKTRGRRQKVTFAKWKVAVVVQEEEDAGEPKDGVRETDGGAAAGNVPSVEEDKFMLI